MVPQWSEPVVYGALGDSVDLAMGVIFKLCVDLDLNTKTMCVGCVFGVDLCVFAHEKKSSSLTLEDWAQ